MAFEEYVSTFGRQQGKDPNYISISVTGGKAEDVKHKACTLTVAIGPKVLEDQKWIIGDKIAIFFGTGEDKGKMLLKKMDKGIALTPYHKKPAKEGETLPAKMMRIIKPVAPIEDFVNTKIVSTKTEFAWDEAQQGILVTLPAGFFTA